MTRHAVERSSGNVFADLGIPGADEHLLKAGLVAKLRDIMANERLTQAAVAKVAGVSQPDLSRVLRGHFRDFSVDRLIRVIVQLDSEIEITVRRDGREIGEPIFVHA